MPPCKKWSRFAGRSHVVAITCTCICHVGNGYGGQVCDVVTINCPLHPETEHMFNAELLSTMKRGSYIVNTARGKVA